MKKYKNNNVDPFSMIELYASVLSVGVQLDLPPSDQVQNQEHTIIDSNDSQYAPYQTASIISFIRVRNSFLILKAVRCHSLMK